MIHDTLRSASDGTVSALKAVLAIVTLLAAAAPSLVYLTFLLFILGEQAGLLDIYGCNIEQQVLVYLLIVIWGSIALVL